MPTGCLKVLAFIVVLPFVLALPPAGFAALFFLVYTLHLFRKDRP